MRRGPLPRQAQQPVAMASFSSLRRRRSQLIASELRGALPEGQSPSPSPSPSPVGFHGRSVSVPEQKPDAAVVDGPTSKSNPAVPHWERTTPAHGGCELRRRRRGSRSKDAIGGGLRESPALGRPMACAGDDDPAGWTVFGIPSGWTVFETPSTPWVPCSHPIGHVPPRSRQSPLHLPQSDLDSDGYSSQRPGPRAPAMPLEFLAGSELRRRPAPLLAAADHRCLAWSLRRLCPKPHTILLPRRKANWVKFAMPCILLLAFYLPCPVHQAFVRGIE